MIVEITTAAVSRRVIHLEVLKADLGIAGISEDDALLRVIDWISAEFAHLLGRDPWMQSYTVRMPGEGGTFLRLPVLPLLSVSLVTYGIDNPTTVDAADYEIAATSTWRTDQLYNSEGWIRTRVPHRVSTSADERHLTYRVDCVAGWATPVAPWAALGVWRLGEYARPSDPTIDLRFEVTTAGTVGSSEPTWPTVAGDTVVDGTATFTARAAIEMPRDLEAAGIWAARMAYTNPDLMSRPAGVKTLSGGGMSVTWSDSAPSGSILPPVSAIQVERYA